MIGSGFIRDLIFLKEQLPIDMIVWCWEHGILSYGETC